MKSPSVYAPKHARKRAPKGKPANAFERRVLDVLLAELRRAMRKREQMQIVIDPYFRAGGAGIWAGPNRDGHSYDIEGP